VCVDFPGGEDLFVFELEEFRDMIKAVYDTLAGRGVA
jgi:hypothetical protein